MNLDELRSVQSKERQKDSLQNLRPSFYQEVGEYIADLEDERDRVAEQADDPFSSPEVGRLTDEIETAKDVVEAVYERRMGKLVKQASLAAAGMPADDDGLTAEEADLFDDLVDRISSNKTRVLDVLEGLDTEPAAGATDEAAPEAGTDASVDPDPTTVERDPTAVDPIDDSGTTEPKAPPEDAPPVPPQDAPTDVDSGPEPDGSETADDGSDDSSGVTPADVMGGSGPEIDDSASPSEGAPAPPEDVGDDGNAGANDGSETDVDRVTVKITRDIGSILGVDDREYSLSTDDIVTLPEQNATPLLEQEAAEPLE
ncbi:hypothetical protein [Natronorubrum texcoconense]|uniref:DNA replication factor GINS n=1 Tax=Natronorubrum texcoconense TaxID=1095776 RepID=A0A1G8V6G3_9EURY|nr:hypothetical protein [Natronorubrum texcoconense]SDJ61457.1 DNA replication factor GINS [Natronorubrum texcoconense]